MGLKTFKIMINIFKLGIFLSLFVIFYVYYFSEVAKKYADKNTYLSETPKRVDKIEPPLFTFCLAGPIAKLAILKKYNISLNALDEPSLREKGILINLNKTMLDFYREATYQLNREFELYMTYREHYEDGGKYHKKKLFLGKNLNNTIKVNI